MKKSNQNKKTKSEVDETGLDYTINFRVTIPVNESTIDTDTLAVVKHVISGLEIVSSTVRGIKLEQSQGYNTSPVTIPILERPELNV